MYANLVQSPKTSITSGMTLPRPPQPNELLPLPPLPSGPLTAPEDIFLPPQSDDAHPPQPDEFEVFEQEPGNFFSPPPEDILPSVNELEFIETLSTDVSQDDPSRNVPLFENLDLLQNISEFSTFPDIVNLCKSNKAISQYCKTNDNIQSLLLSKREEYIRELVNGLLQKYGLLDLDWDMLGEQLKQFRREMKDLGHFKRSNKLVMAQLEANLQRLQNTQMQLQTDPNNQRLLQTERNIQHAIQAFQQTLSHPGPLVTPVPVLELVKRLIYKDHVLVASEILIRFPELTHYAFESAINVGNYKMVNEMLNLLPILPPHTTERALYDFIKNEQLELLDKLFTTGTIQLTLGDVSDLEIAKKAITLAFSRSPQILDRILQEPEILKFVSSEQIMQLAVNTKDIKIIRMVYNRLSNDFDPTSGDNILQRVLEGVLETGDIDFTNMLLDNPRVYNRMQLYRVLQTAARKGLSPIVDRLLSNPKVTMTPEHNFNLLINAIQSHNLELVDYVLRERDVDPSESRNFALLEAIDTGRLDIVDRMLQDTRIKPNYPNNNPLSRVMEKLRKSLLNGTPISENFPKNLL